MPTGLHPFALVARFCWILSIPKPTLNAAFRGGVGKAEISCIIKDPTFKLIKAGAPPRALPQGDREGHQRGEHGRGRVLLASEVGGSGCFLENRLRGGGTTFEAGRLARRRSRSGSEVAEAAAAQAGSQEWSDDSYALKAEGTDLVDTSSWAVGDCWGAQSLFEKELEQNRRRQVEMTLVRRGVNGKIQRNEDQRLRGHAVRVGVCRESRGGRLQFCFLGHIQVVDDLGIKIRYSAIFKLCFSC